MYQFCYVPNLVSCTKKTNKYSSKGEKKTIQLKFTNKSLAMNVVINNSIYVTLPLRYSSFIYHILQSPNDV